MTLANYLRNFNRINLSLEKFRTMNYILSIVASLSILSSCSSTKEVAEVNESATNTTQTEQTNPPQETEHKIIFEDIAKGDSLFASIRKGYCFGTCPVYTMNIYNSGYVKLVGKANIEQVGEFSTTLTYKQMKAFVDYATEMNYMGLDDVYDNVYISDLPETNTSIVLGGKRKSVKRRYGFPKSIVVFEKMFASLLETEQWTKQSER